ncbi:MAG: ATP synthase F0 subunit C [Thermodesulfobacteriota bacterium]|nr:ATP synthase F0 subunit C [Thermodesulfobacteriota bacterium]
MRRRSTVCFLLFTIALFSIVPLAFAAEEEAPLDSNVKSAIAIASGFAIGVAAFGGGMGQGRAIASGLEGIARNPGASGQILTPMIIGLALIESLVIYALVISFMLYAKL